MHRSITVILAAAMLLSGCATTSTGPISAGDNTYVISRQAGAFPSGREPLLAEAMAEANTQCSLSGRSMRLITTQENPGPYILGNYPKATVAFECVEKLK